MNSQQLQHQIRADNILHRYEYHWRSILEQVKLLRKTSLNGLEEKAKEKIQKILEEYPDETIKRS